MARNSPVRICTARQIPKREPKFHHDDRLEGVGRSTRELLIIFKRGWVFRMLVIRVLIVEIQRWLFMPLVMGIWPCENYDNVCCIYFKYYFCVKFCWSFF